MRMNKKLNQKGFSLVEVIVSMLILSIVIVSLLSAFTTSAKANNKTKLIQGAEALASSLTEYVEAGGEDFLEFTSSSNISAPAGDPDGEQTFQLSKVLMGYNSYTVKVTKDNSPDKYDLSINKYDVIKLGDSLSASIMVDASDKGCDENGDGKNDIDDLALNTFYTMNLEAIDAENTRRLLEDPTAEEITKPGSQEALENNVAKEIILKTKEYAAEDKMSIEVLLRYILDDSVLIPASESRVQEYSIFTSEKYYCADTDKTEVTVLGSIYLAYQPSSIVKKHSTADIRIIGDNSVFGANVYIALQDLGKSVTDAVNNDLASRMSGKSTVKVDFAERSGIPTNPHRCHLYCSGNVTVNNAFAVGGPVSTTSGSLVATDEKVRAIGYKFEVLGDGSSNLATSEIVVLQR